MTSIGVAAHTRNFHTKNLIYSCHRKAAAQRPAWPLLLPKFWGPMNPLLPGQHICDADGYIRGHGTNVSDQGITSSYFGNLKQINKLVTVYPCFSFQYTPEVGDVVIGRIGQIFNKKWKVDTNSRVDTTLSLSAINLPGVMQRRKSETDEMNMRAFFNTNDLIVCEVQKISKTGPAALHTRNDRYRKLTDGVLVRVPQFLLLPLKTRFLTLGNIEVIAGCNGYIWVSTCSEDEEDLRRVGFLSRTLREMAQGQAPIDAERVLGLVS